MHTAQVDHRQALSGIVAIPVTPFDSRDRVDEAAYQGVVRRMLDEGVRTVTPGGNTGEFYSLDESERRLVVELTVAETAASGVSAHIVAGVGHDVATAVRQARHARAAGAQLVTGSSGSRAWPSCTRLPTGRWARPDSPPVW